MSVSAIGRQDVVQVKAGDRRFESVSIVARLGTVVLALHRAVGERSTMPMATIQVIEGVFSPEEKARLIEKVTDALVSVEGEPLRDKTVVLLEEVRSGNWGVGGTTLTADAVRQLRAKR
jgi:4-oxalocrotonate tautomerase